MPGETSIVSPWWNEEECWPIQTVFSDEAGDFFVELPDVGSTFDKGEEFGTVESVKAVSDVYAPLTGTIEEINDDLIDAPEIINTSPYEDGWMVKIRMADAGDADDLMDAEAYQALVAEEG